ncbi:UNKNOWN [Stylonychia lemnae]|uniref:TRP C-terminal domain-containing protein n=1 Tax=Stylonychia lemnae TaxID=5949 RepID=A0A078AB41_STYLE|nr:UNKNOWN [Stylonychia lemnae]|eukprot:CDW79374.1 UNKNOWN [Stylonychia lemnae]
MIYALMPILLFIICYFVWSIISCKKRDPQLLKSRAISSIVILLFFVYSNIVQQMLDAFNCIDVDGEDRMKTDLEVLCFQGPHYFWSYGVAMPAMIVWGLGIPLFASQLMYHERHKLDSLETKAKYGFLFRGYKKRFYYWESIVMYRKTLLIFISVFFVSFGVLVQAMIVMLLLIFGITTQMKLQPYQTEALNILEVLSFKFIIKLFFLELNIMQFAQSSNKYIVAGLSDETKIFFFFVIVIFNMTFFLFWVYYFFIELREHIIKKLAWVYLNFILCGNKRKLVLHQQDAIMKEENEILREEYMNALTSLKQAYEKGDIVLNQQILERFKIHLNLEKVQESIGLKKLIEAGEQIKIRKMRAYKNKSFKKVLEFFNENTQENKNDDQDSERIMKLVKNPKEIDVDASFNDQKDFIQLELEKDKYKQIPLNRRNLEKLTTAQSKQISVYHDEREEIISTSQDNDRKFNTNTLNPLMNDDSQCLESYRKFVHSEKDDNDQNFKSNSNLFSQNPLIDPYDSSREQSQMQKVYPMNDDDQLDEIVRFVSKEEKKINSEQNLSFLLRDHMEQMKNEQNHENILIKSRGKKRDPKKVDSQKALKIGQLKRQATKKMKNQQTDKTQGDSSYMVKISGISDDIVDRKPQSTQNAKRKHASKLRRTRSDFSFDDQNQESENQDVYEDKTNNQFGLEKNWLQQNQDLVDFTNDVNSKNNTQKQNKLLNQLYQQNEASISFVDFEDMLIGKDFQPVGTQNKDKEDKSRFDGRDMRF